jgi:DNA-binding PadR family transcriptional regulator
VSVRHTLLALLSEGPKYGWQLRQELEARSGQVGPLNEGRLYPALGRLERAGLIESAGPGAAGPHRKFRITAGGTGELAAWLYTAPDLASAPHGQVVAKVLAALRVPGTDVHEVIQVHRRAVMERMQRWTRVKRAGAADDLGPGLRIDAELIRLDSVIRWLDAADGRLANAADGRLANAAASPPWPAPAAWPGPRAGAGTPPARAPRREGSRAAGHHIRVCDRDRERTTARLRDSFAEGRLTREELDERITAALSARTAGELGRITADLP